MTSSVPHGAMHGAYLQRIACVGVVRDYTVSWWDGRWDALAIVTVSEVWIYTLSCRLPLPLPNSHVVGLKPPMPALDPLDEHEALSKQALEAAARRDAAVWAAGGLQ